MTARLERLLARYARARPYVSRRAADVAQRRERIALLHRAGLTVTEIARAMGLSRRAVAMALDRPGGTRAA